MSQTNAGPDFSSLVVEEVSLPYDDSRKFINAYFTDPKLIGYRATIVEDSLSTDGEDSRLTTMAVRYPRSILAEMDTHRVFSRNTASSRARSVKSTIRDVMIKPMVPLFTKNQKGMSGKFLDDAEWNKAEGIWLDARDKAVRSMLNLLLGEYYDASMTVEELLDIYDTMYQQDNDALSVHKQDANRIIEPFMWTESIITSSYWENFFKLRTDLDNAHPSFYAIALLMEEALKASTPVSQKAHLPFVARSKYENIEDWSNIEEGKVREVLMLSATEAAQVSYRDKISDRKPTATVQLGERLLARRHLSPFEHIALSTEVVTDMGDSEKKSNLSDSWVQGRKLFVPNTTQW